MMSYDLIEDAIVARLLTPAQTVYEAKPIPEVEAEQTKTLNKPIVTVAYNSSEFAPGKETFAIVQEEKIHIEVIVSAMRLRGASGLHQVAADVKRRLLGFRPLDLEKMRLTKNAFTKYDQPSAVWSYSMIFVTTAVVVEEVEADSGPLLTDPSFSYNNGTPISGLPPQ